MAKKEKTPAKSPKKQGWKIVLYVLGILLWAGAAVIVSQFVVGYFMVWILGTARFNQPVWTAIYSALFYTLAMFVVIYIPPLILKQKKTDKNSEKLKLPSREELGLKGFPTWTDIGLAPIGFVVYLLLAAGITAIFSQFSWFNASEVQDVGFSYYLIGFDRLVAFITIVMIAPIAEEIIFRGWLYGKLRAKLNTATTNVISMTVSSLLVSLLFGFVHMQWNVSVNVFAMSLVLCALREITGTIYSGIILHMLKNGVAFYLLYILGVGV